MNTPPPFPNYLNEPLEDMFFFGWKISFFSLFLHRDKKRQTKKGKDKKGQKREKELEKTRDKIENDRDKKIQRREKK